MFGWLNRRRTQDVVRFDLDRNGRPTPPSFPGLFNKEDASDTDRMTALMWAKQWCGYQGEVTEKWLYGLNNRLAGKRERGERKGEFEEEKRVLEMAVRLLRFSGARNRTMRTARIFHSVYLKIGPVDLDDDEQCPCNLVLDMEGRLLQPEDYPMLPLPGCTAGVCRCHVLANTFGDAKRKGLVNSESGKLVKRR